MKCTLFKSFALLALTLILLLSFTACGASESMSYKAEDAVGGDSTAAEMDGNFSETITDAAGENVLADRKIIETIELSVQTKEFDKLLENLNAQIASLGGYVESSDISGREIDSDSNRWANMTIRIPAEHSEAFTGFISDNSVVVNRTVTTEDVTLSYVDIESRLAALQAEKTALEQLLANAASTDEIILIRDQLTEVIYEIESCTAQLRTYDNLVDYCTVEIYIDEVERTIVVEEQNVWQEIGVNLSNNFADVWNGMVDFFVFAVSSLPYLIPGAIIAVIVIVIVLIAKKSAKKKEK